MADTLQKGAYFRPRRLGHVNIWVDNLKRSEKFYNQCCGLTVEFSEPDLIATFLGTGQTPHDLGMMEVTRGVDRYGRNGLLQLPGTIGLDVGLNHLAWELEHEADLVNAFKSLKRDEIATDITVDHQVAHSVYIFDPDGNYNEYYCDTVRDWQSVLQGEMELITSDWDPLSADASTESLYDPNPTLHRVEDAPLNPTRITHAVLRTPDPPRLVDFYTRVGGLHVVATDDEVVYLGAAHAAYDYNLVLIPDKESGFGHSAFEMKDDQSLAASAKALNDHGVTIDAEIDLPWKHSLFLRDPDGLRSEYYVRRDGARNLRDRGSTALIDAA